MHAKAPKERKYHSLEWCRGCRPRNVSGVAGARRRAASTSPSPMTQTHDVDRSLRALGTEGLGFGVWV